MKTDRKIYRTASGQLTDNIKAGAFLFLAAGIEVTPGMLKNTPGLEKFMPKQKEAEPEGKQPIPPNDPSLFDGAGVTKKELLSIAEKLDIGKASALKKYKVAELIEMIQKAQKEKQND
jgi:hypothetical protein